MRYELKTKGTEKIIAENERIRKELKKVQIQKFPNSLFLLQFVLTRKKTVFFKIDIPS